MSLEKEGSGDLIHSMLNPWLMEYSRKEGLHKDKPELTTRRNVGGITS